MGWGLWWEKCPILVIIIRKLVIASVEDIYFLPAAIIYFFEAAHFTHLRPIMPAEYINQN